MNNGPSNANFVDQDQTRDFTPEEVIELGLMIATGPEVQVSAITEQKIGRAAMILDKADQISDWYDAKWNSLTERHRSLRVIASIGSVISIPIKG